jgi:hypothetical protein
MNKKRDREVSFDDCDTIIKCSKLYDYDLKDYSYDNNNIMRKIKIIIHKSDLEAFKHIITECNFDDEQIQEIVEMLMSAKFYEALSYLGTINDSVNEIMTEDFETMIEEYGLDEDSIYFYFECYPKKMFKTFILTDNDLFRIHMLEGHSSYLLSEIKSYIENGKLASHFKDLFTHNTKKGITNKMLQTFGREEFKGMDKAFERAFDTLKDYIDISELQKHESIRLVYERYVATKNIHEAFSNLKI